MTTSKEQIKGVARHLRLVCSEEIEDLEDQLPQVTNLIERDSIKKQIEACLLYTSPSPRDGLLSRMPSSA